ncbi:phage tail sheath C-terminal domain-containing protein [Geodermatophilus sp. SYSU D00742]
MTAPATAGALPRGAPGVDIEWVSADRPVPAARRTDVAAFVGFASRGPAHEPTRIGSSSQFRAVFGGHDARFWLAHAVDGFFANGGDTCWVVRVVDPDTAAPATASLPGTPGTLSVTATATSGGGWANGTRLVVDVDADRFTLTIDSPAGREAWPDLSLDGDSARFAGTLVNDESRGSRIIRLGVPPTPGLSSGGTRLSGGRDGLATVGLRHLLGDGGRPDTPLGLAALDALAEVSLVALPDAVPRDVRRTPVPPAPQPVPCCSEATTLPPTTLPPTTLPPTTPPDAGEQPPGWTREEVGASCATLLDSCARHHRFALLDVPDARVQPDGAIAWRDHLGLRSNAGAFGCLVYPWILTADPLGAPGDVMAGPTCGHVAGIVARSDRAVGVHKAPANETVAGALDVAYVVDDPALGRLNDRSVDTVATRPGRGIRLMGARTLAGDPAWRYTNVRRLVSMVELSLETLLAWLVFEPNLGSLSAEVEREVRAFLTALWERGALDGARVEDAFSVRCVPSNSGAQDADPGRLLCLIGLQPPLPAEFVTVRVAVTEAGVQVDGEQGRQVRSVSGGSSAR